MHLISGTGTQVVWTVSREGIKELQCTAKSESIGAVKLAALEFLFDDRKLSGVHIVGSPTQQADHGSRRGSRTQNLVDRVRRWDRHRILSSRCRPRYRNADRRNEDTHKCAESPIQDLHIYYLTIRIVLDSTSNRFSALSWARTK